MRNVIFAINITLMAAATTPNSYLMKKYMNISPTSCETWTCSSSDVKPIN